VNVRITKEVATAKSVEYATGNDFCRIFNEQMNSLYTLSFLLTADHEKAEQCFVSGLQDSVDGNPVFMEWAHAWARRTIIKNALRLMDPRPAFSDGAAKSTLIERVGKPGKPENREMSAILALPLFERFVFVMSVLEQYSDQDCSLLLGCPRRDVAARRTRALARIASSAEVRSTPRSESQMLSASA
jgi:hypothetical protein